MGILSYLRFVAFECGCHVVAMGRPDALLTNPHGVLEPFNVLKKLSSGNGNAPSGKSIQLGDSTIAVMSNSDGMEEQQNLSPHPHVSVVLVLLKITYITVQNSLLGFCFLRWAFCVRGRAALPH